jgi:hypothetical protein
LIQTLGAAELAPGVYLYQTGGNTMKKVVLVTAYDPQVLEGETENHYGVPFVATATGEENEKGDAILCLVAELPDDEANAMIEAERVVEIEPTEEELAEKAAAEKAAAEKAEADAKAAAEKAAKAAAPAAAKVEEKK